jgi:hypothetical protein
VAVDGTDPAHRRAGFQLLGEARSAGLTAQMDMGGRSLKGQLANAGAIGARWVGIVRDGSTELRDTQGGERQQLATDAVVHAVLRGHNAL